MERYSCQCIILLPVAHHYQHIHIYVVMALGISTQRVNTLIDMNTFSKSGIYLILFFTIATAEVPYLTHRIMLSLTTRGFVLEITNLSEHDV